MRSRIRYLVLIAVAVVSSVATTLIFDIARADEERDRWREERDQKLDLLSREKNLLREADDLSRDILEIKQTMNALYQRLSAKQTRYQNVNHELISVQMKLLR